MKTALLLAMLILIICTFSLTASAGTWVNLYDLGEDPGFLNSINIVPLGDDVAITAFTSPEVGQGFSWILRLDSQGNVLSKKDFLAPLGEQPEFWMTSITPLNDGGIVVSGKLLQLLVD